MVYKARVKVERGIIAENKTQQILYRMDAELPELLIGKVLDKEFNFSNNYSIITIDLETIT